MKIVTDKDIYSYMEEHKEVDYFIAMHELKKQYALDAKTEVKTKKATKKTK